MKNIFLLVHDDIGQEARLQAALDLTRAMDGHLTCVDVSVMPIFMGDYGAGEAMVLAAERQQESRNKAAIEARLASEDVPWDWIDALGNPSECVLGAANLADLIVLNLRMDDAPEAEMRDVASRTVMHARKPIVAVPPTLDRFEIGRVLIAWDGQGSVASTMRACVPLLKLAAEVRLFMAHRRNIAASADDAAEYLSRHGIQATVHYGLDDGIRTIDTLIEEHAQLFRPDYIMMGAYSHGRLAELFGGNTKRMLAHSKRPLVLGH
ncbi:nucleotide-binding universal stress UspA family protein [Sphingomonas vulcanisoli]|uniref:Nucleotide-binding universal stress UspA family protein n=1 Tax=Sphingomonas vulcanisoli TaxID=1658060 RepID=A0ABX0TUZ6_9SPHN|nr:universal stress protein [Sphingomonas vulcanisoli]NIJ09347.1 nucleotide-binding universal stress UspA family protein [Sphingomonas vulcanisoli]